MEVTLQSPTGSPPQAWTDSQLRLLKSMLPPDPSPPDPSPPDELELWRQPAANDKLSRGSRRNTTAEGSTKRPGGSGPSPRPLQKVGDGWGQGLHVIARDLDNLEGHAAGSRPSLRL